MRRTLVCLAFLLTAKANAGYPPMPEQCPAVGAINVVGIHHTKRLPYSDFHWVAFQENETYGTTDSWSFALGAIASPSNSEALQAANSGLGSLKLAYGPEELLDEPHWICVYRGMDGLMAAAITPPKLTS